MRVTRFMWLSLEKFHMNRAGEGCVRWRDSETGRGKKCVWWSCRVLGLCIGRDSWIYIRGAPMAWYWQRRATVCLSICVSISLCVYLSVCLSICLSVCLSIYLSIYLSICVSLSACLSIYLSIYLSVYLSFRPSVCLPACLAVCLAV